MKYAEYIDYTNLKANATTDDIKKIMYTAKKPEISAFFGWCVHCVHGLGGVYIFIQVCSHRG